MSTDAAPRTSAAPAEQPIALGLTTGAIWLFAGLLFSVMLFYFVCLDQGATSVFGNQTFIHEFVHDARHLLGAPCH